MSLTIIDALKAKGSSGGNTIMEAIENLPEVEEEEEFLLVHLTYKGTGYKIDRTFDELG